MKFVPLMWTSLGCFCFCWVSAVKGAQWPSLYYQAQYQPCFASKTTVHDAAVERKPCTVVLLPWWHFVFWVPKTTKNTKAHKEADPLPTWDLYLTGPPAILQGLLFAVILHYFAKKLAHWLVRISYSDFANAWLRDAIDSAVSFWSTKTAESLFALSSSRQGHQSNTPFVP